MNLLGKLALLFVVVPILELALLVQVGQWVGLLPTLLLVAATGISGAWLARSEGVRVLVRFRSELAAGHLPGQAILDGLAVLVGGAFLLTPGILTDVAGFALLLPPTRRAIQRRVRRSLEKGIREGTIQVVEMGPTAGGFGVWSSGSRAAGSRGGPAGEGGEWSGGELDPSKEVRTPPGDRGSA
jgi:UPF0716 protein FxsA